MAVKERNTKQISITMSNMIMEKMETEAKKLGMNRSAFISMCISQYFNLSEAQYMMSQINDLMNRAQAMKDEAQLNLFQMSEKNS